MTVFIPEFISFFTVKVNPNAHLVLTGNKKKQRAYQFTAGFRAARKTISLYSSTRISNHLAAYLGNLITVKINKNFIVVARWHREGQGKLQRFCYEFMIFTEITWRDTDSLIYWKNAIESHETEMNCAFRHRFFKFITWQYIKNYLYEITTAHNLYVVNSRTAYWVLFYDYLRKLNSMQTTTYLVE